MHELRDREEYELTKFELELNVIPTIQSIFHRATSRSEAYRKSIELLKGQNEDAASFMEEQQEWERDEALNTLKKATNTAVYLGEKREDFDRLKLVMKPGKVAKNFRSFDYFHGLYHKYTHEKALRTTDDLEVFTEFFGRKAIHAPAEEREKYRLVLNELDCFIID